MLLRFTKKLKSRLTKSTGAKKDCPAMLLGGSLFVLVSKIPWTPQNECLARFLEVPSEFTQESNDVEILKTIGLQCF